MIKQTLFIAIIALFGFSVDGQVQEKYPYQDSKIPTEQRVMDLLGRMTLEEKIAQLSNDYAQYFTDMPGFKGKAKLSPEGLGGLCWERFGENPGSIETTKLINAIQKRFQQETRLGIPPIIHAEGLHGVCSNGFTIFPQAIGMASTWNTDLMVQVADAISKEARAVGIRQFLSPVLNVGRDPRWGRIEETFGEDPYLISRMGVAFCKPIEANGVITTPKHFELNFTDGGRESNEAHLSNRIMHEIYFPAYKAVFKEAGSKSLMAAYNAIDGAPCSTNKWLLTDILRGELGFKGFTVTDYEGLLTVGQRHKTATSPEIIAKQAIEAGMDRELPQTNIYGEPLLKAVKTGMVKIEAIDSAVVSVLRVKFAEGLFENRFVDNSSVSEIVNTKEHRALAYKAGLQSIVLLKNNGQTLPFKKGIKRILVAGPHADEALTGGYSGWGVATSSILDGLKNVLKEWNGEVKYTKAGNLTRNSFPIVGEEFLFHANEKGELQPGVIAEYYKNINLSGNPDKVKTEKQIDLHGENLSANIWEPSSELKTFAVRWKGKIKAPADHFGKLAFMADGGVRIFIDGKLLVDQWNEGLVKRTIEPVVDFNFIKGQLYDFVIEYYNYPHQFTDACLEWDALPFKNSIEGNIAKEMEQTDAGIFVANIDEGECSDRALLSLSPSQEKLILAMAKIKKPFIVVLVSGGVVTMNNWVDEVPAIIEAWYPGEEGGKAMSDVIFGNYNPGGKLPINFPVSEGQLPIYYNNKPSGRNYFDYNNMTGYPLFPFGHGLSYTSFTFSNLHFSADTIAVGQSVNVEVDIQNSGQVAGDEVVQLYLRDEYASVSRPLKELKGFKRISLNPGEKKRVTLTLTSEELSMWNNQMKWVVEPGEFTVMIGSSSEDIRLEKRVFIKPL